MRRPKTQHKQPNVITTLFIIIRGFNAKGNRIAELHREWLQRKFGMNMDREAVYACWQINFIFNYNRRMKSMLSSERNVPAWASKPPATAAESQKNCGHGLYKATNN